MAFDAEGYRKEAQAIGIPQNTIDRTIKDRSGVKGWLTEGKKGLGGAWNTAMNVLNVPSYAVGGALQEGIERNKKPQEKGLLNYIGNSITGAFKGMKEGIQNKETVQEYLPSYLGINPQSTKGKLVGFAGELATPDIPFGDFARLGKKGLGAVDDVTGASRAFKKVASKAGDVTKKTRSKIGKQFTKWGDEVPLSGLGRTNEMKKFLFQVKKSGLTVPEFMEKHNLWDRSSDLAKKAHGKVAKEYIQKAYKSKKTFNIKDLVKKFDDELSVLKAASTESDNAAAQYKRLLRVKHDFLQKIANADPMSGLYFGAGKPIQNIGELAKSKNIISKDVLDSYFIPGASKKGKVFGAEKGRRIYKNLLDKSTGGATAKLGAEESALIEFNKLLGRKETAKAGNKRINAFKWIPAGVGVGVAGVPGAVAGMAAQGYMNSPAGLKKQSKLLTEIGNTIMPSTKTTFKGFEPFKKMSIPQVPKWVQKGTTTTARVYNNNKKKAQYGQAQYGQY